MVRRAILAATGLLLLSALGATLVLPEATACDVPADPCYAACAATNASTQDCTSSQKEYTANSVKYVVGIVNGNDVQMVSPVIGHPFVDDHSLSPGESGKVYVRVDWDSNYQGTRASRTVDILLEVTDGTVTFANGTATSAHGSVTLTASSGLVEATFDFRVDSSTTSNRFHIPFTTTEGGSSHSDTLSAPIRQSTPGGFFDLTPFNAFLVGIIVALVVVIILLLIAWAIHRITPTPGLPMPAMLRRLPRAGFSA